MFKNILNFRYIYLLLLNISSEGYLEVRDILNRLKQTSGTSNRLMPKQK